MANQLEVLPQGDQEILITRSFDAPRELVWRTLTEPELIQRWLLGPPGMTMPFCEVDLRVGGAYRYVWHKEDDPEFEMALTGTFLEIGPFERIVLSELFDPDWTAGEAINTTVLKEEGAKTYLTITVRYASPDARDAALETAMDEGMEAGYQRLDEILADLRPG